MELTQLKQFKAIAEYENISRAAETLYMTQPALSYSLRKLEEELGVKLFDRSPNSLKLNAAGKKVLSSVNIIMREIDVIIKNTQASSQKPASLRFCSPATASLRFFLPHFVTQYPEFQISSEYVSQSELDNLILSGKYDVGISISSPNHKDISQIIFFEEHQYVTVPEAHPLAIKDVLTFADLVNQDFAMMATPGYWNDLFRGFINNGTLKINAHLYYDYVTYLQILKSTNYLSFCTNISRKYTKCPDGYRDIPLKEKNTRANYYIVYRTDNALTVEPFIKYIKENLDTLMSKSDKTSQ